MKDSATEEAILAALTYSDLFDYPLREEEVFKYLYRQKASLDTVREVLNSLVLSKRIEVNSGYFFLPSRELNVEKRRQRKSASELKMQRARRLSALVSSLSWVEMLAVTGAVAVDNSEEPDDIDFMIVTSPRRLWLTRLVLVLYLKIHRLYRSPKMVKDTFCLNVWLSSDAMFLGERNIFVAREICQMRPLLDRGQSYQRFLDCNSWVFDYFPNWKERLVENQGGGKNDFLGPVGAIMDRVAYGLQRLYMLRKKTIERVSYQKAFFHPQDVSGRILSTFQTQVSVNKNEEL